MYTVVYNAVYSLVFSIVYAIMLVTIYMKQIMGGSSGIKSAHPVNFTFGISLLYIKVYNVYYGVHFTFQYSIIYGRFLGMSWFFLNYWTTACNLHPVQVGD